MSDESDRKARARTRSRTMLVRKTTLGDDDDLVSIHGDEAFSLVHRLTRESWSLAGLEMPRYSRREIPVCFVPGPPA